MRKEEKERAIPLSGAGDPARAAQKDTDARAVVSYSRARLSTFPSLTLGTSHISIDRKWRFVRGETCTHAARYDGHEPSVLDATNSSKLFGRIQLIAAKNEAWLKAQGYRSNIHRKKPRGKPMAKHIRRGNATRSSIVFGYEKGPMAITKSARRSIGQGRWPDHHGQAKLQLPPPRFP